MLAKPAPDVEISKFTAEWPELPMDCYCDTPNFWRVYLDINKIIAPAFFNTGNSMPETPQVQRQL